MQTQGKKVSHYFYKTTFPRKKQNSLFMALMKREILTSQEVLYTKFCVHNQCLFCKKDAFQNTDFSQLTCQLQQEKIDTACF